MKIVNLVLIIMICPLAGLAVTKNKAHPYEQEFKSLMKNLQLQFKTCGLYSDPEVSSLINQTQMELTIAQTRVKSKRKKLLRDRYSFLRMARNYPKKRLIEFSISGWKDLQKVEDFQTEILVNERKRAIVLHEYLGIQEIEVDHYRHTDLILSKVSDCLSQKANAESERIQREKEMDLSRKKLLDELVAAHSAMYPEQFIESRLGFCKLVTSELRDALNMGCSEKLVLLNNHHFSCFETASQAIEHMKTSPECLSGFDRLTTEDYLRRVRVDQEINQSTYNSWRKLMKQREKDAKEEEQEKTVQSQKDELITLIKKGLSEYKRTRVFKIGGCKIQESRITLQQPLSQRSIYDDHVYSRPGKHGYFISGGLKESIYWMLRTHLICWETAGINYLKKYSADSRFISFREFDNFLSMDFLTKQIYEILGR